MNEIIHGDNVEVLKTFANECIDLTITSPPYDNLRTYKGHSWDFENLANELYRVTKQGGVVVWVVGDATINGSETGTSFKQALYFKEIGFNLHDTMIYQKNKAPIKATRYQDNFEYMFVLSKGAVKTFNPIQDKCKRAGALVTSGHRDVKGNIHKGRRTVNPTKTKPNVWFFYVGNGEGDAIAVSHPARFPEKLAYDHIISWSNEGDTVLDPFSGSGTTCKMAKLANRKYIGIEIAKEYCDLSVKRINNTKEQPNLF